MECVFRFVNEFEENLLGFCNNIATAEGGTHLVGFKTRFTQLINSYARELGILKEKDTNFTGADTRNGMIAVVAVKHPDPVFEGQTKTKLANCESRDAAKCEIFIVEGDSAGGSAKMGRNRQFQAILPIRGKILNVEKAPIDKVLANAEIKTMINAFGCGFSEGYGNDFDITKLRYDKIVLMTDADVDGSHIDTLLLTFLYRFMPDLIREGHVYIAMPPLYKVGEMDPDQLWETTLNPENRVLKRVEIEDGRMASEVTEMLMGSDVPPRRNFIHDHADEAEIDA